MPEAPIQLLENGPQRKKSKKEGKDQESMQSSTTPDLSSGFASNKGTDQPVYLRSLISAFVIRLLNDIKFKLPTGLILILLLFSVYEQVGLGMTWSE